MSRRGLTLLELLIVLGLLLALGALVFPALMQSLDERAFESSADVVRNQLLLARAHAQTEGEPVEVIYHDDPPLNSRVEARRFEAGLRAFERGEYLEARRHSPDAGDPLRLEYEQADPDVSIPASWAVRRLPDGLRITDRRPLEVDEEGGLLGSVPEQAFEPGGDALAGESLDERASFRLAVFLPDGSALLGEPFWIKDGDGRLGVFEVNHWTGLPTFDRIGSTDRELPQEDAEAEREQDEPEPFETPADGDQPAQDEPDLDEASTP